ncbi:HesB/YadR/YfhF family protein [Lentibacillus sediminis]|uniref:HesB/YadR/YfhF family protein n=1 Tax=Lentibacillus sediminis TaxID=1940529 RepID=UPI000C1C37DF|nr:HesB/YadR/YfhF family protein [Lentibacillus sediminis]
MNIQISKEAAKWYRKELDITGDTHVRFYVRYGGFGGNIPGFSLGVGRRAPEEIHTSTTVEGVTFFIEQNDAWYFEGKDLKINLNHKLDEPDLKYV